MPVATIVRGNVQLVNGARNQEAYEPRAWRGGLFYDTGGYGVPRRDDLLTVRLLEDTHTVALPMDTIKDQVAATPWVIRPKVQGGGRGTQQHRDAADEAARWLRQELNANAETFEHFLKAWVHDILSIDAGVIELVPGEPAPGGGNWLGAMYWRDGAFWTKNPDRHGRLPPPGDVSRPAYYQFGLASYVAAGVDRETAIVDLIKQNPYLVSNLRASQPIPFARDAVIWTETSPRPKDVYGLGRVQKVRRIAEIVLNQDTSNLKYFAANEVPEGLLNLLNSSQEEIERFREYWRREILGREHKLPIVGGEARWLPFRPSLVDLQFLESQVWYNKLVWMIFGLNPNEVGLLDDVNRATAAEQATTVFRRTTEPLLNTLAGVINRRILPTLPSYHDVNGELEFAWEINNPAIKALERAHQLEDLNSGTSTVNEVRQMRGLSPLPWGDMPLDLMRSLARANPRWALSTWLGLAEEELPPEAPASFFGLNTTPTKVATFDPDYGSRKAADEAPDMEGHVTRLSKRIQKVIEEAGDDLIQALEAANPEGRSVKGPLAVDWSRIISEFDMTDSLKQAAIAGILEAMQAAAEADAARVEAMVNQHLEDESGGISLQFRVQDTFAYRALEAAAASRMRTVNDTVKQRVHDSIVGVIHAGGNVTEVTRVLRDRIDELAPAHARLVARTEVLQASRAGSQALAESTDLITGKEWRTRQDGRVRSWHAVMHGVVVPKEQSFLVPRVPPGSLREGEHQPSDYPREAFVVGEDQPFNCRCNQRPKLREDLPKTAAGLLRLRGVARRQPPLMTEGLTDRQRQVLMAHGRPGESFEGMLRRLDGTLSRNEVARVLDVSKRTLYGWLGETNPPE